jgi:hypothetical protein
MNALRIFSGALACLDEEGTLGNLALAQRQAEQIAHVLIIRDPLGGGESMNAAC